jgi:DNA modification methylase
MFELIQADCFEWLSNRESDSIEAVCTDPPYGVFEFSDTEIAKMRGGRGGVWRLPPTIGGSKRSPLPRFTVLTAAQLAEVRRYFMEWGTRLRRVVVPGAHVLVAGYPSLQHLVQSGMAEAGFEVRGALMRMYWSFRGGDRPKNAETEFPEVCVTPKGAYEPWMLFRKPISEKTVAANLRRWNTGGLRRLALDKPLPDLIPSGRTPDREVRIADHPCIKPQHLMRVLVRSLLPLGLGTVLDTFAGSGATLGAAEALGYQSIGVELDREYFEMGQRSVPLLSKLYPDFRGEHLLIASDGRGHVNGTEQQQSLALF